MPRSEILARFTLAGATVGLLAGLFEAGLLYFHPRLPGLGAPDVSYLIWIVAPLAALTLLALCGAVVGSLGALLRAPGRKALRALAAVILAAGAAYLVSAFLLFQDLAADLWSSHNVARGLGILLAAFAGAYLILRARRFSTRFFSARLPPSGAVRWRKPCWQAVASCWESLLCTCPAPLSDGMLRKQRPAPPRALPTSCWSRSTRCARITSRFTGTLV